jgi:hypothetical protein
MPTNLNTLIGEPEKDLPIAQNITDSDFLRIVTTSGQSKLITFYNSVKKYVNDVLNLAIDKMLKSDGSVNMDSSYTPIIDQAIATKKFTDDSINDNNTVVMDAVDVKLNNLKSNINTSVQYISTVGKANYLANTSALEPVDSVFELRIVKNFDVNGLPHATIGGLITGQPYCVDFEFDIVNAATNTTSGNVLIEFNGLEIHDSTPLQYNILIDTLRDEPRHKTIRLFGTATSGELMLFIDTRTQVIELSNMILNLHNLNINI